MDDATGIYVYALEQPGLSGVLNGVAPEVATNQHFTQVYAGVLKRPAIFPAPAFVMNMVLGPERAKLVLEGQHVVPKRTLELGYKFKFPNLQSALEDIVK